MYHVIDILSLLSPPDGIPHQADYVKILSGRRCKLCEIVDCLHISAESRPAGLQQCWSFLIKKVCVIRIRNKVIAVEGGSIMEQIDVKIRTIKDYPEKGLTYPDITTLIKQPVGFRLVISKFAERYAQSAILFDTIVGIESRGFIIGGALAYSLGKGFVPIRRGGKLPAKVVTQDYERAHGRERMEMHADALRKGDKVLLVDDLVATGATALAAASLIEKLGGSIAEMAFVVDMPDAGGKQKLLDKGYSVFALTRFASA